MAEGVSWHRQTSIVGRVRQGVADGVSWHTREVGGVNKECEELEGDFDVGSSLTAGSVSWNALTSMLGRVRVMRVS